MAYIKIGFREHISILVDERTVLLLMSRGDVTEVNMSQVVHGLGVNRLARLGGETRSKRHSC